MIITKMALPRRTFLRGIGATLALPLLDAMVPALSAMSRTAATPVHRLGFLYLPNGVAMNHTGINYWKPAGEGGDFELSPILAPLAAYREQMVVDGRRQWGSHAQHRDVAERRASELHAGCRCAGRGDG